ncbi:hypothetical protein FIC87_10970 [Eggerthella lenta]|uniref:Uncharacterized protein n=2 Tax=Eggerthellaceae TaxID=1643826 RepID=A0A5C5BSC3_EGGLN|nr:hypothetical protein [Eggerthella lenta]MDU6850460.1 hypothetical protein [Eggerthella sp.]TNU89513.1 hypothetical protein FIC87_10970 [Eggerthella lenta]
MKFHEQLNAYIERIDCMAKEVSELSGISAATLSRYRTGTRIPDATSESFENLCSAIAELAERKQLVGITAESVREQFMQASDLRLRDTNRLLENFDLLLATLDVSISKLCRHINYDASTVFRFRNGSRHPSDPEKFASSVAEYVAREWDTAQDRIVLAHLLGCSEEELASSSARYEVLVQWLYGNHVHKKHHVSDFLSKLDEFNLNDYIKAIHFDELKVPSVPFQMPVSKTYFGIDQMMESELDFLKATVVSKSNAPVIMYSDMPMAEMAKDPEFPKKWMYGMAMMLKKGLHLNQIHDLNRSFEDMMLGLESWIPMYMTGQISPFYLKEPSNNVFLHLLKVSGAAALSGEAVMGYHAEGKYYLTKSKKELRYYTKRAQELLSVARPLMDIYRVGNKNELNAFLQADSEVAGKRKSIFSSLPLYTIDMLLLEEMLAQGGFSQDEISHIEGVAMTARQRILHILESSEIEVKVPKLSEEEFEAYPLALDLSAAFCEQNVVYTYEQYLAHMENTDFFATEHSRYRVEKTSSQTFRNLQINIHEGKWAMVSKVFSPAIHFVIYHPKLRRAIEEFIPPVVEE